MMKEEEEEEEGEEKEKNVKTISFNCHTFEILM